MIVRCQDETPPQRTLEEAAGLAVYYSQARGAGKAPVDYCPVRQVKKPSGAMRKPEFRSAFRMKLGRLWFGFRRKLLWLRMKRYFAAERSAQPLPYLRFSHATVLLRQLKGSDMRLQRNKITNLKLAAARLNGIVVHPGQVFSYWKLIGRPSARKGYLAGMDFERLRNCELYLLDMDGTLYLGDEVFDGAVDFIRTLSDIGRRYIYLTNNSSRAGVDYVGRLRRLGFPCEMENVFTSGMPDGELSILDGAITASGWQNVRGDSISKMYFDALAKKYHFKLTTPVRELPQEVWDVIMKMSRITRSTGVSSSIRMGTAGTRVFAQDKGVVLREPTVVAVDKYSGQMLKTGEEAQKMLGRTPANIVAIHPITSGVINDYDMVPPGVPS